MTEATQEERLRTAAESIRSRVDLLGKALAAIATTGTTAVGLTKIGDLFPTEGHTGWAIAAVVGLAVAAWSAIRIAIRLIQAGNPNELLPDFRSPLTDPIFMAAAERFGFKSLVVLQERERSLREAASRAVDDDERKRRTALADEIEEEIDVAVARAQVIENRRQATEAVSDKCAKRWFALVIAGLLVFALGTDAVSSDRTDATAAAKACGDARTAGATAYELGRTGKVCEGVPKPTDPPAAPTAEQARVDVAASLTDALKACVALVPDGGDIEGKPLTTADCAPIRAAAATVLAKP